MTGGCVMRLRDADRGTADNRARPSATNASLVTTFHARQARLRKLGCDPDCPRQFSDSRQSVPYANTPDIEFHAPQEVRHGITVKVVNRTPRSPRPSSARRGRGNRSSRERREQSARPTGFPYRSPQQHPFPGLQASTANWTPPLVTAGGRRVFGGAHQATGSDSLAGARPIKSSR